MYIYTYIYFVLLSSGFDEPGFKATWDFTVIAPKNTTVISNGAIKEEILLDTDECYYIYSWGKSNKCKKVIFETTPIVIAPYILTVFVGEYKDVSQIDSNGVTHYIWSNLNEYKNGQFAVDVGVKILPYYQKLIEYPYGTNKMENIGVTSFPYGGMEAYGAIVYWKTGLLVDIEVDPLYHIVYTAAIVAHEYVHMWYAYIYIYISNIICFIMHLLFRFGDIVTCAWWDDTWLNEGFARFYGYDSPHIYFPEYNILSTWIERKIDIMNDDASIYTSTVIGENVQTASEIDAMFSDLQYDKAGSVINMMQYTMGNDTYNEAIKEYINTYAHKNVISDNLFEILNNKLELSGNMISSFVSQPGFPAVFININTKTDNNITFELTQKRFIKQGPRYYEDNPYFDPEGLHKEFAKQNWYIHTSMITASDSDSDSNYNGIITNESYLNIEIPRIYNNNSEYYLFNNEFKNYYSVIYDDILFNMILNSLESLSYWNKQNIIIDRFIQMKANYVSVTSFLELIKAITDNNNIFDYEYDDYLTYTRFSIIIESLIDIDNKICNSYNNELLLGFRNFSRIILRPFYEDLNGYNFDNNSKYDINNENINNLRNDIIVLLIRFGDEEIINIGYQLLNNLDKITFNGIKSLSNGSDVTRSIINAAMAKLDINMFYKIIEFYADASIFKKYIRESFTNIYGNDELLKIAYNYIVRGESIDNQYSNITLDLYLMYWQMNTLNILSSCNGVNYVWEQLWFDRSNNEYNGTKYKNDFQYFIGESYYKQGTPFITEIPNKFTTLEKFNNVYQLYLGNDNQMNIISDNEQSANYTLENIAANIDWNINNKQGLTQYLANYTTIIINDTVPPSTSPTEVVDDASVNIMKVTLIITFFSIVFV